jgi:hypothetical protein
MLSFTGSIGIRDSQSGKHGAFEAFHRLGLVVADVVVS